MGGRPSVVVVERCPGHCHAVLSDKRILALCRLGTPTLHTGTRLSLVSLSQHAVIEGPSVSNLTNSGHMSLRPSGSPSKRPTDLLEVSLFLHAVSISSGHHAVLAPEITPVGRATGTVKPITRTLGTRASRNAQRARLCLWNFASIDTKWHHDTSVLFVRVTVLPEICACGSARSLEKVPSWCQSERRHLVGSEPFHSIELMSSQCPGQSLSVMGNWFNFTRGFLRSREGVAVVPQTESQRVKTGHAFCRFAHQSCLRITLA